MMSTEPTLADLVATNPSAAKVFQRYGLDYCCGGKQSLKEACAAGRVDADTVLRELAAAETGGGDEVRWAERPIDQLIEHILDRYHAPLRAELPRLVDLARQVERVHADKPDRPDGLADLLADVYAAVTSHLAKEEQILFPLIRSGRGQNAYMPVQVMVQEHEDHGQNLRRIRKLTNNLKLPDYACASWRELYRALGELEVDLMDHIHLENNILFPRALAG
ncbi:MAG: iron-sulfur cluster repair protein YtfE [Deltaproteobacteria bacterium]|nr:iron-sulfur cluster repair protein YtfE [Deltaproteobacteria bacterium]